MCFRLPRFVEVVASAYFPADIEEVADDLKTKRFHKGQDLRPNVQPHPLIKLNKK